MKPMNVREIWDELVKLEPNLAVVEAWVLSLDPNSPEYNEIKAYGQLKEKLLPLVGWGRNPPGYEEVPFEHTGRFYRLSDRVNHDDHYQNDQRRRQMISRLSKKEQILYSSPAWDIVIGYLYDLLPAEKH